MHPGTNNGLTKELVGQLVVFVRFRTLGSCLGGRDTVESLLIENGIVEAQVRDSLVNWLAIVIA